MNSFLERLTLVIHWIAFLITLLIYFYMFVGNIGILGDTWAEFFFGIVFGLIPNTIGWLIKYVLTGNSDYFPFKLED